MTRVCPDSIHLSGDVDSDAIIFDNSTIRTAQIRLKIRTASQQEL